MAPTVRYLLELLKSVLNYFLIEKLYLINQKDTTLGAIVKSGRVIATVASDFGTRAEKTPWWTAYVFRKNLFLLILLETN